MRVRWTKRARANRYENRLQMPDTSYVVAHSRETHFEHSFPDGSPSSLFQEISLPVASAAFHDKVEAHRNDTYASQKGNRKGKNACATKLIQLTSKM